MSQRLSLKWLISTMMELLKIPVYYTFFQASKVAIAIFIWVIYKPTTLKYSTNMYERVTGSFLSAVYTNL